MKKYLFLLLFIPLMSFGQIITYDKLDGKKSPQEIDIRELTDTYITVELDQILPSCHLLSTSEYKNIQMRNGRKKKWNVYDEGVLIRLVDRLDVLNFFSKYGYVLATSNTETYGVVSGNMILPFSDETITLMKKLD
tara:strand:- start:554 stop:961 length:408 start_codon:yes stop_codon:yes gene_type:complete